MKKLIYILSFITVSSSLLLLSCDKPEEMTPRIEYVSDDYLLPTGSILNAQDRDEIQALWDEYNSATNQ